MKCTVLDSHPQLAVHITIIAMEKEEKKVKVGAEGQEKVTNMVGTFLNEDRYGLQKIKVATTQVASEKVASTVATFLSEDLYGLKMIRVTTTKAESKKVTNMVGTFLTKAIVCGQSY